MTWGCQFDGGSIAAHHCASPNNGDSQRARALKVKLPQKKGKKKKKGHARARNAHTYTYTRMHAHARTHTARHDNTLDNKGVGVGVIRPLESESNPENPAW